MSGGPDLLYVSARTVPLDAAEALTGQSDAFVLVGAQAIYVDTGHVDFAVAEYTSGTDSLDWRPHRGGASSCWPPSWRRRCSRNHRLLGVSVGLVAAERRTASEAGHRRAVEAEADDWGRWGADDERGALNLITPERRRRAAVVVRKGISVSLARDVVTEAASDRPCPHQVIPRDRRLRHPDRVSWVHPRAPRLLC